MKRALRILALLLLLSLACNLTRVLQNERGAAPTTVPQVQPPCEGGGCEEGEPTPGGGQGVAGTGSEGLPGAGKAGGLLYHLAEWAAMDMALPGMECSTLNFMRLDDAGLAWPEGGDDLRLELMDHPLTPVAASTLAAYYYISAPEDPTREFMGARAPDWDVPGQTLWRASFTGDGAQALVSPGEQGFPGDVLVSPGNRYLVFPLTDPSQRSADPTGGMVAPKQNPFLTDSSLGVLDLASGASITVLDARYNRQLFRSFGEFSSDGKAFYTLMREGDEFRFVRVELSTGEMTDFAKLFPEFPWGALDWGAFFPTGMDANYADFSLAPNEERMVAFKNFVSPDMSNVCAAQVRHTIWVLDLEGNTLESYPDQPWEVNALAWSPDAMGFAISLQDRGGCYPEYLQARIDRFDRDGTLLETLVSEPESKIIRVAWSEDGQKLAYDVYGMDYVGRLKLVEASSRRVQEVINTQDLGILVSAQNPITILLVGWVQQAD